MVRFKNRWLLVEFIPVHENGSTNSAGLALAGSEVNAKSVYNALRNSVVLHFGAAGWGAVGSSLNVKYFSPITNVCIVRVGRDHHRIAWGAVTLLTSLGGKRYIPQVIHVSGTIKKVQLAAIQHDREVIARVGSIRADAYPKYLESSQKEIESLQD